MSESFPNNVKKVVEFGRYDDTAFCLSAGGLFRAASSPELKKHPYILLSSSEQSAHAAGTTLLSVDQPQHSPTFHSQ